MIKNILKVAMAGGLVAGLALAQGPSSAPDEAASATSKVKVAGKALRHKMLKGLGLTDAQKQQAKAMFQETKTANAPIKAQLDQNFQSLEAAVKSNNSAQIQQLAQARATLRGQMLASRSQAMAKLYASLTPDQKAKADRFEEKVRKHTGE